MAGVRVQVTGTVPDLTNVIKRAVGPAVERRANKMGQAMVDSVKASVARYKVRPANRRRYPGSTRITTGWDYKIVGDPQSTPIFVNLLKRGDAVSQQRVEYLDKGTGSHVISKAQSRGPGGQFGTRGWLRFPRGDGASSGPPWVYARQVVHPGYDGDHFLDEALQAGIAAARS